jgi:DNA (cytosine-5)-methyltransferase 1
MAKKQKLNFIDVFSGAGGLSTGLELAGMNCILGVEIDKYAVESFKANHKNAEAYCGDITKLDTKKLNELLKNQNVDAVVGGPPCQGFSTVGIGDPKDTRNQLFREFVRIVKITKPNFIVIENVTGLLALKNEKTLNAIFKLFANMGFILDVQVMSAENYGVPEKRRRTIIIGSRINQKISFPLPSFNTEIGNKFIPAKNVGEALKNLKAKNGKIYNHELASAEIKSKLDLDRIKCIPEGCGIRYEKDEINFLPKKLKLGIDWKQIPENRFRQTKYQRLDRKKPSPTIMTHRHNYFHPVENRYLTPREAAAIQSFPNDFVFHGPISAQWKQIGNAVPPLLGFAIGNSIIEMSVRQSKSKSKTVSKNRSNNVKKVREKAFIYRSL